MDVRNSPGGISNGVKGYTTYAHKGLHYLVMERSSGAIAPRYNGEALLRYSSSGKE